MFLAGHHTILNAVILSNISNVTFKGGFKVDANITVVFQNSGAILCRYVKNMAIKGLTFKLNYSEGNKELSALAVYHSEAILRAW